MSNSIQYVSSAIDRVGYANWATRDGAAGRTAEQLIKELDAADLASINGAISEVAYAKGEGTVIFRGTSEEMARQQGVTPEKWTGASPVAQTDSAPFDPNHPYDLRGVNVDFAIANKSKINGGDLKSLAYYADFLRSEAANNKDNKNFSFTGTWGSDKITNSVDEYTGWLFQAAAGVK